MPRNPDGHDNSDHLKQTGTHLRSFTKIFRQVLHAKACRGVSRGGQEQLTAVVVEGRHAIEGYLQAVERRGSMTCIIFQYFQL